MSWLGLSSSSSNINEARLLDEDLPIIDVSSNELDYIIDMINEHREPANE